MKPKVSSSVIIVGEVTLPLCVTPLPHNTMVFTDMLGSTCIAKSPIPKHMNCVDSLLSGLRGSGSTSSLLAEGPDVMKTIPLPCHIQGRSLSECSVDSEDSFIVFHESPSTIGYSWKSGDIECLDLSDSSDDEDDEMCIVQVSDGEFNGCDSDVDDDEDTFQDTCDGPSQRVEEINQRWQLDNPSTAQKRKSNCLQKQVCFAPPESLQTVHPIIAWDYAYRASRVGPWEEMARDRARFRTRIERMEAIIAPVLNPTHRKRMLERREELAPSVITKCDLF